MVDQAQQVKAQSAIEYLTTYGWAIIIIAIVLAALFDLGLFNPGGLISTTCVFPAEFGCISAILSSSSGYLNLTLQQTSQSNINITAIGCNNQGNVANMIQPVSNPPSNILTLPIGSTASINIPCYQNGTIVSINPGQVYKGYILINYTSVTSGFPHTATGTLVAKAV